MAHSEICPVCGGSGRHQQPEDYKSTACKMPDICHGCGSRGWVEVADDIPLPPLQPTPETF